jgi:23S rRNA (uracil1939-C5)-methyltransferase
VPAYNELSHTGLVRHLYLRFSERQILVCLIINGTSVPHGKELVQALREACPNLAGIVVNHNTKRTNVILGKDSHVLWGDDFLDDTLRGLTFRLSVPSFYQVNHAQTEVLYGLALDFAQLTGSETVLDLYCGIGTITLCLAQKAGRVYGAEVVPEAIEDAKQNAERNGISNTEFFCGDAADIAAKFAADGVKPQVVCVDPPRKGLAESVVDSIAQMAPDRVVYVSCDPDTLARDVSIFRKMGYDTDRVYPVDMFPRTGHVETIVCLNKQ